MSETLEADKKKVVRGKYLSGWCITGDQGDTHRLCQSYPVETPSELVYCRCPCHEALPTATTVRQVTRRH